MLSFQLHLEFYKFLVNEGINFKSMFVHSGGVSDPFELEDIRIKANENKEVGVHYSDINSGTSTYLIREEIEKAKQLKEPILIFSTYNSAYRIEDAMMAMGLKAEIVLNDEAHFLVQEQFFPVATMFNTKRRYFFTATMVRTPSDDGRGMNNKNVYGEPLYVMKPIEAIDMGKMVRPRMHYIVTSDKVQHDKDDFSGSLGHIISEAYNHHQFALNGALPKMLVSTKGTNDIKNFLKSKECKKLQIGRAHV